MLEKCHYATFSGNGERLVGSHIVQKSTRVHSSARPAPLCPSFDVATLAQVNGLEDQNASFIYPNRRALFDLRTTASIVTAACGICAPIQSSFDSIAWAPMVMLRFNPCTEWSLMPRFGICDTYAPAACCACPGKLNRHL